jgi:Protein of unknown function (DUF2950)
MSRRFAVNFRSLVRARVNYRHPERNESMQTNPPRKSRRRVAVGLLVAAFSVCTSAAFAAAPLGPAAKSATAATAQQELFSSPKAARDALVAAASAQDQAALDAIFGPEHERLKSGDPVQDQRHFERFAVRVREACTLQKANEAKYTLLIGANQFPFPIPIVKDGDKWRFDTKAGLDEILNRRIGNDELSAIMTCRAYALAQWEYFSQGDLDDDDGLAEYAQKFISTPGMHDGLYWETTPDEDPSPLGPLVAEARAEGYGAGRSSQQAAVKPTSTGSSAAPTHPHNPYHGYYFKILTRQGRSAPGGAFSYLINGHMIAGFALVAYPAKWGNSGVMTFIVNTQGRVYQKNLGPKTDQLAPAMKEYNPDPSWQLVPKD